MATSQAGGGGGCKIAAKVPRDTTRDKTVQIGLKITGLATVFDSLCKSHFGVFSGGASWGVPLLLSLGGI